MAKPSDLECECSIFRVAQPLTRDRRSSDLDDYEPSTGIQGACWFFWGLGWGGRGWGVGG